MEQLTSRQEEILGIVVREYIASAVPVGSQTIVRRYGLGLSPATVRNELAFLEREGYLLQTHASAGRIPSDKGYRYFVHRLMQETELSPSEQRMISHQFHQVQLELQQWMKLAAAVLAQTARSASLVTAPKAPQARLKHLEMISLSDVTALLVMVFQDGSIRQQVVLLPTPTGQDELTKVSNHLNELLGSANAAEVRTGPAATASLTAIERHVVDRVAETLEQMDRRSEREIHRDGLIHVLRQPEFAQVDKFRQVVEVLERRSLLESIIAEVLWANGVQVIIGGEGRWDDIEDYSLVLSPYGVRGEANGVVGVLGPTRMPYDRAIPAVRFVARLMSSLVEHMYGY
ncbi:MAG: heat-inducible transcriptional repressor HrcA [Anaerolineae bacterium]|nr:heat-inducible transcriptional repressor HrcA [Anaerolineae bacterium]